MKMQFEFRNKPTRTSTKNPTTTVATATATATTTTANATGLSSGVQWAGDVEQLPSQAELRHNTWRCCCRCCCPSSRSNWKLHLNCASAACPLPPSAVFLLSSPNLACLLLHCLFPLPSICICQGRAAEGAGAGVAGEEKREQQQQEE